MSATAKGFSGALHDGSRSSVNLEFALLAMLLCLSAVVGLIWVGNGVSNVYGGGGEILTGGSVSGPVDGTITGNGAGGYDLAWSGGTAPYALLRSGSNDMAGATTLVSNLLATSHTLDASALEPGQNFLQVLDAEGKQLPMVIPIELPLPPGGITTLSFRTSASFGGWSYVSWHVRDADGDVITPLDIRAQTPGAGAIDGTSFMNDDTAHPDLMGADFDVPAGQAYTMCGSWGEMPDGVDVDSSTRDVSAAEAASGATVSWSWY